MQLNFYGADRAVTGSCHGLTVGGYHLLIDCGLQQGRDELDNHVFPFAANHIDDVIVTHAHIDHSGRLPLLVKQGFRGSIFATEMTCRLLRIMLLDSGHIQESDAEYLNRKAERSGKPQVEPLYTIQDVEDTLKLLVPVAYDRIITVNENVRFQLTDAGHLLGSAYVQLWASENGEERKLVFSGDIGNVDQPVIKDPEPVSGADYVIMESTYGNRNHEPPDDYCAVLTNILRKTFLRGGSVIIPSFAVGRTQELLYFFREIKQKELLPAFPDFQIVVDSPLAVEATQVFTSDLSGYLDEESAELVRQGIPLFSVSNTRLVVTSEESKALNEDRTPKVIIAASGMCDAGRIRHHLKHNLWRPECTVVFVGYQAYGSLGRALQEGKKSVKLFGEEVQVRASIETFQGLSSHADHDHLVRWAEQFKEDAPKQVFVVHGEEEVAEQFVRELRDRGFRAHAPLYKECFDLISGSILTEGVQTERKRPSIAGSPEYRDLEEAGRQLQDVIRQNKGLCNRELKKFTAQLRKLIEFWKTES